MPGYNARICTLTWYLFTCIYYMFIFIVMLNWLWKMHKKTFKQQKIMELIRMSGMRPKIKILCTQALTYLRNYQNVSELEQNHFCFIMLMILQAALFSEFDIKVHSNLSSCSTESIREKLLLLNRQYISHFCFLMKQLSLRHKAYESILCIPLSCLSSFHSFICSNCFLEFPKLQTCDFSRSLHLSSILNSQWKINLNINLHQIRLEYTKSLQGQLSSDVTRCQISALDGWSFSTNFFTWLLRACL